MTTFVDSGSEESTEESYRAQIELDRKYLQVERDEFYQNRRQSGYEPTLYVQNIDRETTEDELRVWFSEFGPIQACRLQKNPNNFPRTNAFIHYYYTESCDKAIEAMNGKFRDKNVQEPLVVKWEQRHGTHYQNLFINRTAKMISKDELKDRQQQQQQQQQFNQPAQTALSSLFPTTATSNVFPAAATADPNLQQALLLLSNPAALISLLTNSANLQQQSLPPPLPPSLPTISPQISSQVSQQLSQRFDNTQRHDSKQHLSRNTTTTTNNNDHTFHSTSGTKIYINNVGPNTTEDVAKPIFAQYGTVVDMRLAPQNSYALVTYADNLSAQRAIAGLNGQSILAKDGMTLNVTFKTNKANSR